MLECSRSSFCRDTDKRMNVRMSSLFFFCFSSSNHKTIIRFVLFWLPLCLTLLDTVSSVKTRDSHTWALKASEETKRKKKNENQWESWAFSIECAYDRGQGLPTVYSDGLEMLESRVASNWDYSCSEMHVLNIKISGRPKCMYICNLRICCCSDVYFRSKVKTISM